MNTKIEKLLRDGEGLTVEFKRCHDKISPTVYETVCSFSNRYGGDILLGVLDDGTVEGIAPEAVRQIKKDFSNSLNNPQIFNPTLNFQLEEVDYAGKVILYCHIPLTSQLVTLKNRVYDRNEDGDYDVTANTDTLGLIAMRKRGLSSVEKIYRYTKEADLLLGELMPAVRNMSSIRIKDHPWQRMSDMEILKSAGLYRYDQDLGYSGFTLAAILLFGREEVIRSVLPGYVTDCILRRDDLDRYDDRLRVSCNLIEAYDKIMGFIAKHTLDRFYLEGALSVSPRDQIARELTGNILSHREFTSTIPAKVIIERDRIVTENWCLPKLPGKLDPATFTPQPKNPLIANFFVNIHYADMLGSGVRNLYKYTKIYTNGGEPELIEGDMFRTIVPLSLTGASENRETSDKVSDKRKTSDKTSDKMSDNVSDKMSDKSARDKLLAYLRGNGEVTAAEAAAVIDRAASTARRILTELMAEGLVESRGANRNRKYRAK
ncbi:MAG: putative DNA binding domain-containing protein [Gracilibacteraceae bacterium]|jgi:ATP-dependent DNA helicase RecG|nr:putative DNA binding domain-containing protein [Gracilibacteraceae bacterium]